MVIFIDTNIIIDALSKREPFATEARQILKLCNDGIVKGYISSQTISDTFYILRKDCLAENLRSYFIEISTIIDFIGTNKDIMLSALKNLEFTDFEDCVQSECAAEINADYIVTRNIKDFALSKISAIMPRDFLEIIGFNI